MLPAVRGSAPQGRRPHGLMRFTVSVARLAGATPDDVHPPPRCGGPDVVTGEWCRRAEQAAVDERGVPEVRPRPESGGGDKTFRPPHQDAHHLTDVPSAADAPVADAVRDDDLPRVRGDVGVDVADARDPHLPAHDATGPGRTVAGPGDNDRLANGGAVDP